MKLITIILSILLVSSFISCKKYLDAKPDKKLSTISSLRDLQALLDRENLMNFNRPALGEASADNYFLNEVDLQSMDAIQRNRYLWRQKIFNGFPNAWAYAYNPVYCSNLVLDNVNKFKRTIQNKMKWDNVKGSALFYRAISFLSAITLWAKAYDETTADKDLGIPLRLTSDFTQKSTRATVQESYDRIINDLKAAVPLLPIIPKALNRPSKPATYALLARTYLFMGKYKKAKKYSDSCLFLHDYLLDFNTLAPSVMYPIQRFNKEVIFHSRMSLLELTWNIYARVDSTLYRSYSVNDLRKSIFFKMNTDSTYMFRGSYCTSPRLFNGIATDEVLLIRAECEARLGNVSAAMDDLNSLLITRWKTTTFTPFFANSKQEALDIILTERRKELIFRGLRWIDIKRLNMKGANIVIKRYENGKLYTLPPNDNRYALPIPNDVIVLTGMQQNPR